MPRDRIRAAIIGCGRIAGGYDERSTARQILTHAKAYTRHPATRLVAVADADANRAKAFARRWGVPAAWSNARRMLEEARPEIVSICTPDETHAEYLRLCLDYPVRAVWCEKPLVTDVTAGEGLVAAYEQRGIPLAVNYLRRWDRCLDRLRETWRTTPGSSLKAVVTYGKGLRRNGSHALDLLLEWFGPVRQVRALSAVTDHHAEDPTVTAWLGFENGAEASLIGCDERHYTLWELDLLGPSRRVRLTCTGLRMETYSVAPDPVFPGDRVLDAVPHVTATGLQTAVYHALENLLGTLEGGEALRSSGRTALETLRVCHWILRDLAVPSVGVAA